MPQVTFEEIECKRALNRVHVPSMPSMRWSLNPYRGCQHACVYCFARGNHEYLGYNAGRDFERRVIVKRNLVEVLRRELRRPGWRREHVAIGIACDPYQQAELKYGLTRGALQAFRDHANPCSLITRSPNILRDLPVLRELSDAADCTVLFSVATLREDVWRHIEPETASPSRRLETMTHLSEAGIRCGVILGPVIPGLTDGAENLEAVALAALEHGASFVDDNVVYLKPATEERFMPFPREAHPHVLPHYERFHHGGYAPRRFTQEVHAAVQELRERWGLTPRQQQARRHLGQLTLAL